MKRVKVRHLSFIDRCCLQLDTILQTLAGEVYADRPYPADGIKDNPLTISERQQALALMRVNHSGEVCAQALYQGQALTANNPKLQSQLQQAAREENDHLAWCYQRLQELHARPSYLDPLWYTGALLLGMLAGLCGDQWNAGLLAETERQVVAHLQGHLQKLPPQDQASHAIVRQMIVDETAHQHTAMAAGAAILPHWVQAWMRYSARVMTTMAYWL